MGEDFSVLVKLIAFWEIYIYILKISVLPTKTRAVQLDGDSSGMSGFTTHIGWRFGLAWPASVFLFCFVISVHLFLNAMAATLLLPLQRHSLFIPNNETEESVGPGARNNRQKRRFLTCFFFVYVFDFFVCWPSTCDEITNRGRRGWVYNRETENKAALACVFLWRAFGKSDPLISTNWNVFCFCFSFYFLHSWKKDKKRKTKASPIVFFFFDLPWFQSN